MAVADLTANAVRFRLQFHAATTASNDERGHCRERRRIVSAPIADRTKLFRCEDSGNGCGNVGNAD
jgi:hypothetical protein